MTALIVLFQRSPSHAEAAAALATCADDGMGVEAVEGGVPVGGGDRAELRLVDEPLSDGRLAEAVLHSPWRAAGAAIEQHVAHARLSLPDDGARGPLERLQTLSRLAGALLELPGALALYAEAGGALTDAGEAQRRVTASTSTPPMDLWIGVRTFEVADARGWFLDTLGMAQLGLPDLEAYAADGAGTAEVTAWLRNLALYLLHEDPPARLHHDDTLDGPDELPWRTVEDVATVEPARAVLRFMPVTEKAG